MSTCDADVLVIGAGPAGSSVAIRLACAGWRVAVIEQSPFPRDKVCGECLGPASLRLLNELGVGERVSDTAGPEIQRVGWMTRTRTIVADMPPCGTGPYRFGRAIGRNVLDAALLDRALELGVRVIQPARARRLHGAPGAFICDYQARSGTCGPQPRVVDTSISASIVIDAHGSWERPVADDSELNESRLRGASRLPGASQLRSGPRSELLGFKASFRDAALPGGLLPVLSLPGGYGGMVVSDHGRTTVACCIRRDVLREHRMREPCDSAGAAIDAFLRTSCRGVASSLEGARQEGRWQSIGPLRPGFHFETIDDVLRIGNAAVEAHPVIGEGICIALESAALLAALLGTRSARVDYRFTRGLRESFSGAARAAFTRRVNLAHVYAQIAMRPLIATATAGLMRQLPRTLTLAAQIAGKARTGSYPPYNFAAPSEDCERTAQQYLR